MVKKVLWQILSATHDAISNIKLSRNPLLELMRVFPKLV